MAGKALVLLAALCALVSFAGADSGDATAYSKPYDKDSTGFNACGFPRLEDYFERMFAAMNHRQFRGSCGKCIKVQGTDRGASGKWYTVMIVDNCPTCNRGDVDFSSEAFEKITGHSWDRKKIRWEWTDCSDRSEGRRVEEEEPKREEKEEPKREEKEEAEVEQAVEEPAEEAEDEAEEERELVTKAEETGALTDWVVPCDTGRLRCTNLVLASQGYQCMTRDNSACCLNGNGRMCKRLTSVEDTGAPDNWTGRELAAGVEGEEVVEEGGEVEVVEEVVQDVEAVAPSIADDSVAAAFAEAAAEAASDEAAPVNRKMLRL